MPGVRVDGNDPLACYAVMADAARRARAGDGPTLIEAVTYRLGAHTTSDDPSRYRSNEELSRWAALDPIPRYRAYLEHIGVWSERLDRRVAARSARMRTELREAMAGAPDVDVTEMFDTTYAQITPELAEQRQRLLTELAKEA
jgi:pyruvate dehydrogenase E1 component alpha subunit